MNCPNEIKAFLEWLSRRDINLTEEWEDENIEGDWVRGTSEVDLDYRLDGLYDEFIESGSLGSTQVS